MGGWAGGVGRSSQALCGGKGRTQQEIRTACPHCRAPIAILDPEAIEQALAGYHHAEIRRTTANPEALADALLARHRKDKPAPGPDTPLSAMGLGDLIGAGIGLIAALLSR